MDHLIRSYIRTHLTFRYVKVPDYAAAIRIELAIKGGALGAPPQLNPGPSTAP